MSQTSRYHQTKDEVLNEAEIIESSKKDPKCFKPIYDKYFGQIMQFIYNRIDDKELAADLTQQVFLKALKGLNKYEFIGLPFSSFLYRIASNELNEAFRKNSKLMTINLSDSIVTTLHEELPDEDLKEKIQKLKEVLKQLAEAEFRLLELRFFEDRPFKEIGEILDITENNAKVKTYRALEKLKLLISPII